MKITTIETKVLLQVFEHDFKNNGALTILGLGSAKDGPNISTF